MIETCEHPKRIVNPYSHEVMYVPCRKCEVCRFNRAADWTNRLEIERKCHKFCLFITLTYKDCFRPKLVKCGDYLVDDVARLFIEKEELEKYDYFDEYYNAYNGLPYLRFKDAQNFIKRLRQRVSRNPSSEGSESRYIRYYLCGEYGETTFLPHFHALVFTSSDWLASHAQDVITSCWCTDNRRADSEQLGRVDCELVKYSASAYVAAYLNIPADLPKFLANTALRPRALFSRHPPLGSLLSNEEEIRTLFLNGSVTMPIPDARSGKSVETPLPPSVRSRLYPKVPRYSQFPYHVLSGLYNLASVTKGLSLKGFGEFIRVRSEKSYTNFSTYFQTFFEDVGKIYPELNKSMTARLYSVLRRVAYQSDIFGITSREYFDRIWKFYKDYDYYKLTDQLVSESDLSRVFGPKSCLLVDRHFIDVIKRNNFQLTRDQYLTLISYGYDEDSLSLSDYLDSVEYVRNVDPAWVNKVSKSRKFNDDYHKKRVKYEYLNSDRISADLKGVLIKFHSRKNKD